MTTNILTPFPAPASILATVLISLALALMLLRSVARARGWPAKLRAMRDFRTRSRQRRRIVAALDTIDALVCHLDGKVQNAAQLRARLRSVRELTAAAQLAERQAVEDLLSPPRTHRPPLGRP